MKREVKIGIFAILMLGCAWAGIRFLSGIDIFSRNNEYYAAYDQIGGVQSASPVMIKGVKVGTVTDIGFDPSRSDKVVLQLTVKRQIRIPKDSEAKIVSASIMGSKAIEIRLGDEAACLADGDTLRSGRDRDLMDMAGSELDFVKQRVVQLTDSLSRTLGGINALMAANAAGLTGTIAHLEGITGNVDELLDSEREELRHALHSLASFSERLDSIGGDLSTLTARLADEAFAENLARATEHTRRSTGRSPRRATVSARCSPTCRSTRSVTCTSRSSAAARSGNGPGPKSVRPRRRRVPGRNGSGHIPDER